MNDKLKEDLKSEISSVKRKEKGFTIYNLKKHSTREGESYFKCYLPKDISGEYILNADGIKDASVSIERIGDETIIKNIDTDKEHIASAVISSDSTMFLRKYLERIEEINFDLETVIEKPTFIVGPPGTGKTLVIAKDIEEAIRNNERVLVVSPTNFAVENVFEKLNIKQLGLKEDEIVLNISTKNEALLCYSPKALAETKLCEVQDQIDILNASYDGIVREIRTLEPLVNEAEISLDNKNILLSNLRKDKEGLNLRLQKHLNDVKSLENRLEKLNKNFLLTSLAKTFLGDKEEEIKIQIEPIKATISKIEDSIAEIDGKIEDLKVQVSDLKDSSNETKEKFTQAKKTKKEIETILTNLKEQKEDIVAMNFFKNAKLVGATLVGAALNKKIQEVGFDKIIVDESSMALMPTLLLACLAVKKQDNYNVNLVEKNFDGLYEAQNKAVNMILKSQFSFIGDPKQLSAIAINKDLKKTIFAKYDIERIFKGEQVDNAVLLDINFRCHPEIVELTSKLFYGGLLKAGREHTGKRALYIQQQNKEGNQYTNLVEAKINDKKSFLNPQSAFKTINTLKNNLAAGGRSMGVIAPYNGQIDYIEESIVDFRHDYPDADITCGTVHKFQGKEKRTIIFDMVFTSSQKNDALLGHLLGDEESETARLLNVAMTRAEDFFVLVGDVNGLEHKLSAREDADSLILLKWIKEMKALAFATK